MPDSPHFRTHIIHPSEDIMRLSMDSNIRQVQPLCKTAEVDTVRNMGLWAIKRPWDGKVSR